MQGNDVEIKNQADWDQHVLKNAKPVIVDFWAAWCPPCQKLKPKLHDAAHNNGGKWVLAIVNVDLPEVKELSGKYASQGIPAVYLFQDGKSVENFLGFNEAKANAMIAKAGGQ